MKSDDKATPDVKADDRKELPPLVDRKPNLDEQAAAAAQAEDEKDRRAREGAVDGEDRPMYGEDRPMYGEDRPMSRSEQMRQEREAAEEQSRKEHEEYNRDLKKREAQAAAKPSEGAQKMFVVFPVDAQQAPFHFSNTPNVMLIAAPDEDYARRLAMQEAGHEEWSDPDQVGVEEYKPTSPMVLTRDFKG